MFIVHSYSSALTNVKVYVTFDFTYVLVNAEIMSTNATLLLLISN